MNLFNLPETPTGADDVARPAPCVAAPAAAIQDADLPLVERVRGGDLAAFEELFRRHHRAVYRLLVGLTCRAEDAEDAVQNAFIRAFERIDQFHGAARFSTWLTRIAINEGLALLRERGRFESLDLGGDDDQEGIGFTPRRIRPWVEDPDAALDRAQVRALLEREILKLPVKYRLAVILRDLEQLSTEEAAQSLGLNVATLKTHLLRGRLLLREALAGPLSIETKR